MGKVVMTKALLMTLTDAFLSIEERLVKAENRMYDLEFKNEALEDKITELENERAVYGI